ASRIEQRGGRKFARYYWLAELGSADAAIELGSLPLFFRRRLADFRQTSAYLKPDAEEKTRWSEWLSGQSAGPYIGLCWRSGLTGGLRNLQYAPLERWADMLREMKGTLVSLQYDAGPEEIARLKKLSGREILLPPLLDQRNEIDRTAALIASLNAV